MNALRSNWVLTMSRIKVKKPTSIAERALIVESPRFTLSRTDTLAERLSNRFIRLFRSVWNRIPSEDKAWIAEAYGDGVEVVLTSPPPMPSCACVLYELSQIVIDAWYVDTASDRAVKAMIAHELGHLRGSTGPWPDKGEAVAKLYAERIWEFPEAEAVFKSRKCLLLDAVARESGLKGQFCEHRAPHLGETVTTYLLLKKGQKIDLENLSRLEGIAGEDLTIEEMKEWVRKYRNKSN